MSPRLRNNVLSLSQQVLTYVALMGPIELSIPSNNRWVALWSLNMSLQSSTISLLMQVDIEYSGIASFHPVSCIGKWQNSQQAPSKSFSFQHPSTAVPLVSQYRREIIRSAEQETKPPSVVASDTIHIHSLVRFKIRSEATLSYRNTIRAVSNCNGKIMGFFSAILFPVGTPFTENIRDRLERRERLGPHSRETGLVSVLWMGGGFMPTTCAFFYDGGLEAIC